MNIEPLPKKIYDKAVSLGITQIELHFSGGSDEGYLNVDVSGSKDRESNTKFEQEIEEWAWQAYGYSGAGGGDEYGDDVLYSIVSKTATIGSWYMQRTESAPENSDFEIAE